VRKFFIINLEMVYFGGHLRYSDVLIIGVLGFNNAYLLCNQNVGGKAKVWGELLIGPPAPT